MEEANKSKIGKKGEELAAEYLFGKGYEILYRNYHSRAGEIDIVALDGQDLVFAEVKTAASDEYGDPAGWVTRAKVGKMRKAAAQYLIDKNISDTDCRFDILGVTLSCSPPEIEHIENAVLI
ncbi:MAG: YraN family protein [Fibrobacterota bacterium]